VLLRAAVRLQETRRVPAQSLKERRVARMVFWCLVPFFFAAFIRFYSAIFNLILGTTLAIIFGDDYLYVILTFSLVAAIPFSAATCLFLWRQYDKHILAD
jgi:hypothetical protein